MKYTFRIDDVSVNTETVKLISMIRLIQESTDEPDCPLHNAEITLAVSLGVHDGVGERVFPRLLHCEADFRSFYKIDRIGFPPILETFPARYAVASHGMVHVDHRLLTKKTQELSILVSCSLLKTSVFVPPFHKWNKKTEEICRGNGIELVKYNSEIRHLVYHPFDPSHDHYYFHPYDFPSYEQFSERFSSEVNS